MMHDFPYTDLHELNLDWFLGQFKNLKKLVEDLKKIVINAPDATSATAGQAPIADGAGGWAWGDVATSGDSVPTNVRQAILALFQNGAYTRDDMSDEVAVIQSWATEITSISVNPTTLNINGMNQRTIVATTQPAGGIVTWSSSDETIATVAGGVVTPTGVNGACTITASCDGKSATCAVTVSGFATLLSISAVYTQSGTVYETDTLDSLKSDLVVTANWSDGRSLPVTGYTLSGTLTEGTSTITVAYGEKTTTFNVIVSEALPMLYPLTNGVHTLEDGSVLTITDNNHIKLEASASPSLFVNLYTCEAGTADVVNNKPVWFTLPAGASTTLTVKDITKTSGVYTQFNLRKALASSSASYQVVFNNYTANPTEKNYTPESETSIACPFLYQLRASETFEFTLELVVNGVRYI